MITSNPNINKANAIYIPMMFLIVSTMKLIYEKQKIIFGMIIALFIIFFIRFEVFYFGNLEKIYGTEQYFEKDYLEALEYVNKEYEGREVHVLTSTAEPYIYTLLLNKISPEEFNEKLHKDTLNDDLYSYDNYYFRNITLEGDEICIVNSVKNNDLYLLLQNVGFIEDKFSQNKEYKVLYKVIDK